MVPNSLDSSDNVGIKVSETTDGGYEIEVRVVLEFGVDLAKTGVLIQESIRDQILSMTGNHARSIDIIIDDIKMDSPEKDENDGQWASDSTS